VSFSGEILEDALPTEQQMCEAAASHFAAPEEPLDCSAAHFVEVVRHFDFASHEADPFDAHSSRRVKRHDFNQRLAGLGDDERLSFGGFVNQTRQKHLRFLDIESTHGISLQIFWLEPSVLGDARQHFGANLFAIMKREDKVRPTCAAQRSVRT
jgi:hypothetical protein